MTMAKGIMIVDGQRVPFDGEKNVLSVIRKAGIDMPTFCYYSELSVHGACRMCIVENVKTGKIDASCSMEPRDGLEIRTNTARLLRHRRMILELMLASHDCSCTTCAKSGNCRRPWPSASASAGSGSRTPGSAMSRTTPVWPFSGTPTNAFSAATASGSARSSRARAS